MLRKINRNTLKDIIRNKDIKKYLAVATFKDIISKGST